MPTKPYTKPTDTSDDPCTKVPDAECEARKDCKLPDGRVCPAYNRRHYGRPV